MTAEVSVGVPVTAGLEGPAENGGGDRTFGEVGEVTAFHRAARLCVLFDADLSARLACSGYDLLYVPAFGVKK